MVNGHELYLANYTEGVRVLDLTDPHHPAEFGWADTYPGGSGGFGGDGHGGGIYNGFDATGTFDHCTFVGNRADSGSGGAGGFGGSGSGGAIAQNTNSGFTTTAGLLD